MSLTKIIKENPSFRNFLKSNIPSKSFFTTNTAFPAFSTKNPILVEYSLENSYQAYVLGTASDYMFRFMIAGIINSKKVLENLSAEKGLDYITRTYQNNNNSAKQDELNNNDKTIQKLNEDFVKCKSVITSFIEGADMLFNQVISISIWFAQLEDVYRNALDSAVEIAIERKHEPLVEKELHELCNVFTKTFIDTNIITAESNVVFNPDFGEWSRKIGGADADIYIDGTLYDFKSTKKVTYNWEYIAQIFSYFSLYLLDSQHNKTGSLADKKVNNIALYYSRYGLINTCSALENNLICDNSFLGEFTQHIQAYEKDSTHYKNLAIQFKGYEPIFPQFSKLLLDKDIYGSSNAEDFISKAFPSFCKFDTTFLSETPVFWSGNYLPDIISNENCFFIVRFKASFVAKEGKQPFVKSKEGLAYPKNKVLDTSDIIIGGKSYKFYKDFDGKPIKAQPTLILTKADFLLFLKNYKVESLNILNGCYFPNTHV